MTEVGGHRRSDHDRNSEDTTEEFSSLHPGDGNGGLPFILLLSAVCLFTYANALGCDFVFDDVSAIKENKDLRPASPFRNILLHDFWGTPMSKEQSHKSYRPVCVLSFKLNYLLHELAPLGYHLVNIFLHLFVCLLFLRCLQRVLGYSEAVSRTASLLFAVHPVHSEAVTGVVGRAELLSSAFFLLAISEYKQIARRRRGKCAMLSSLWRVLKFATFVTLAMFSKEQGITVLGICFVYELFYVQRLDIRSALPFLKSQSSQVFHPTTSNNNKSSSPYQRQNASALLRGLGLRTGLLAAVGGILLFIRFRVMGSTLPVFTNFDNPASYEEAPVKQMTWAYMIAANAWLLLCPSHLLCDWTMGTVPLVKTLGDPRNVATLLTFAGLAHLGMRGLLRMRKRLLVALALLTVTFLPASNLFFPVGFVVAERILYLPSMGFCMLIALGFHAVRDRFSVMGASSRRTLWDAMLVGLVLTHGLKSFTRNFDWTNELSLFRSGLRVTQHNAKIFNNIGHAHEARDEFIEALAYFEEAVSVQPDDIGAHINVGRTLTNLEHFGESETAYMRAKALLPRARPGQQYTARIAPQHLSVFLNLANLVSRDSTRLEEADLLYRQAISMRSDYVQAYINRGDVLLKMNRSAEAQEVYEKALTFESENADLYYNLGVVFIEQGKPQQALTYFNQALTLDPEHFQALMNSAILIQESGSSELRPVAYERLFKLLEQGEKGNTPSSPDDRVYFNLGMLAMDDGEFTSAETWFKKAIELKAGFRSALFNLSLLLNEQKRPLAAIPYLKDLLAHFPGHVKGLVLLGDIYTNHVRDFVEAENAYKRILEVEPGHVQAQHNLCVVMVEKGNLLGAESCLVGVKEAAPELDYVARHLEIVRNRIKVVKSGKEEASAASEQEPPKRR